MRKMLLAAAAIAAVSFAPAAFADDAKYSIEKQTIGELVKNPATKAALEKIIPNLIANPQLEQGYEMKFGDVASFVPDELTPENLKLMEAELAKITE